MKVKKILIIIISVLLLSACSSIQSQPTALPKEQVMETAIAGVIQTQTASAPTLVPLSEIKLESYLIKDGDLPAGVSPGQIRDIAPAMFDALPQAENTIYMQFSRNGETSGGVTALLYEDESKEKIAYSSIRSGLGDTSVDISNVGEKASVVSITLLINAVDLVFQRCSAIVHIRLSGTTDTDTVVSYGLRLDERISSIVCR